MQIRLMQIKEKLDKLVIGEIDKEKNKIVLECKSGLR
jgi:hypothetical protein